jgi:hypothetical protein
LQKIFTDILELRYFSLDWNSIFDIVLPSMNSQRTVLVYDIPAMLRAAQGEGTQLELSVKIGVHPAQLSKIIAGRENPNPAVLAYLKLRKLSNIQQYEAI